MVITTVVSSSIAALSIRVTHSIFADLTMSGGDHNNEQYPDLLPPLHVYQKSLAGGYDDEEDMGGDVADVISPSSSSSSNHPTIIVHPRDAFIVRNQPVTLTCRAVNANAIRYKCNGEWVGV